ncbi:MAG: glycosyltransferase family 39 protein [Chloroflexi bacterium]|nr:glycosyltransferase family 39 protein [Chloroflexota bacterium]
MPILLSLVAVLLVGLWLRTAMLDSFPPGVSSDEAVNIVDGFHFAHTGRLALKEDFGSEPFRPVLGAFTSLLFGNSLWAYRYASALLGFLSLAASFWACRQCLADQPTAIRDLAGLCAVVFLATALGHITISRSVYRAVPLTFFLSMAIGFTCIAMRTKRTENFVASALFVALGSYSYATGLFAVLIYPPLVAKEVLTQPRDARRWLRSFLFCAATILILTLPLVWFWFLQPDSIMARASDVTEVRNSLARATELMLEQYFVLGDENPQYNVADAPLIAPVAAPLFLLGCLMLLLRIRHASSLILLALIALTAIPTMITNEISHGLRMYGAFAVLSIVTGMGLLPIFGLLRHIIMSIAAVKWVLLFFVLTLFAHAALASERTYFGFWNREMTEARKWRMYDVDLSPGEWFFRSDRKHLSNWVKAQNEPLLLPVEELNKPIERALLLSRYPKVKSAERDFQLPAGTVLVLPWSLERNQFMGDARHYALLQDNTITILPPLADESIAELSRSLASAAEVQNPGSNIPIVARYVSLASELSIAYMLPADTPTGIARFNKELELTQWVGPKTLTEAGIHQFTLEWTVNRPVSHRYAAFLQLATAKWETLVGEDRYIQRFLHPTLGWSVGEHVPMRFELDVIALPPPGAYRLVSGAWYLNGGTAQVTETAVDAIDKAATIGWIKVPQMAQPTPPADAIPVVLTFGNQFRLSHFHVSQAAENQIVVTLYWTALVDSPAIDATIFVHAADAHDNIVAQDDQRPWQGQYPTFIWDAEEIVKTEHTLMLPRLDANQLHVGMYTLANLTRLAASSEGERLPNDRAYLGELSKLVKSNGRDRSYSE